MSTKVLLVYPPNQLMDIETLRPDGSLGPLYLASALEAAGYETDVLDASIGTAKDDLRDTFYRTVKQANGLIRIGLTPERISEVIAQGGYSIIGINANFAPQTRIVFETALAAKRASREILVIAGGVTARAQIPRFLASGVVDVVCLTEGERIIVNLVRAWEKNRDISSVSGIARLRDGQLVRQFVHPSDVCQNLDDLPVPAWDKLVFPHYEAIASPHAVLEAKKERYASIMTSRGCWASCLYCHISHEKEHASENGGIGSLRFKSVERVMQEVEKLRSLGVRRLYFEDDTLLAKKQRILRIFTQVRGMGFSIADVNGVNLVHLQKRDTASGRLIIDREYLELLRDAGFDHIEMPVESGSQRIINKYATGKLNHATLNVEELVRILVDIGISCPVNIMIGFPDETEEEMRQSIELGKRLVEAGAENATPLIAIPFPGSMLFDYAVANGHLDKDLDPDLFNWKRCVMKNTIVPPEHITELRDWGWHYMNNMGHISARLAASAGARWESGKPTV